MSNNEIYRAIFTTKPVYIAFMPGLIFFTLLTSAAFSNLIVGVLIAGLPLGLLMFLIITIIKKSQAVVYTDSFEFTTTIFSKSVRRIEASKIESVDFRESVIGKKEWGSVQVRGSGTRAISIGNVRNPEKLSEALRSIASSPSPKSNSEPNSKLISDLSELKEMFDKGIISESEFEKAKSKLLK
jgi:hypothetical protein